MYSAQVVHNEGHQVPPEIIQPKTRLTKKKQKFLDYYFGEAALDAREAARLAGYLSPRFEGSKLKAELSDIIEAQEYKLSQEGNITAQEVVKLLGEVAREQHNASARVRALEILARIHGLITDKLSITLDRKSLMSAIDEQLSTIKKRELPQDVVVGEITESTSIVKR